MSAAWTRKAGQNPRGGLNAKGRASYKAETGGTLRPPVKAGDNPQKAVEVSGDALKKGSLK